MCRIRDTVLLRPKNPEDSPVKDDHERPLTRQKKNKHSSTSISPVSKIAVVTATLAALAMTFYDQFSKSDPNVAVVKLDRDQASDPSIKLGLPKGPPELLKGILGDLTKKAEKAKQNGTSLSPLEQQRLDLLQQKKQKGEL